MKLIAVFIFLLLVQFCSAQTFSKAKIYTRSKGVIDGFVKNTTYEGTPQKFSYSITTEGTFTTIDVDEITKIELENGTVYENFFIAVPVLNKEYLNRRRIDYQSAENQFHGSALVEKLITGPVALYQFVDKFDFPHFFYRTASDSTLVLMPYQTFVDDSGEIRNDFSYRNLLSFMLQQQGCDRGLSNKLTNLQYDVNPMLRFFKALNACMGQSVEAGSELYRQHTKPEISVIGGVASTALHFVVPNPYLFPGLSENAFSNSTGPLVGISVSLVPKKIVKNYRANFELFYHSYKSETDSIHYNSYTTGKGSIKLSMLSLSPNICFFLSKKDVKPFLEGGFVISKVVSKHDQYEYYASSTKYSFPIFKNTGTDFMALAGVGVNFSRFVINVRYHLSIIRSASYTNVLSATVKAKIFK